MRIDKVELDNALCFRHLSLPLDHNFQLVAGPNNAGKSSLVRLIELFFTDPTGDEMLAVKPANSYYPASGARTLISIKLWFADLSTEDRNKCAGALRQDKRIWVAVRCSKAGNITLLTSQDLKGDRARAVYEYVLTRFHFTKIPSIRLGGSGDIEKPASLERLIDTFESLLVRTGHTRSTAMQQKFSEEATGVETMVKEVLDASAASIHAELPFQGGNVVFRMPDFRHALRGLLEAAEIESGEGAVVPLAERGTGFQSALILGVLRYVAQEEVAGADSVVFAIEEPEAFLHPQTQRAMTQIVKSISADAQVLVTTHSPVVTDTVSIGRIARLPLAPDGTDFSWEPPPLSEADEGRLDRYCTAGNSELIFANAVVLVEGFGDKQVVEFLLDEICTDAGGYFAQGITVISAEGVGKIKHLVSLAKRFGVRSHVIADKDSLRSVDGSRRLFAALQASDAVLDDPTRTKLAELADTPCETYADALALQVEINSILSESRAFVLASDLEGLLVDSLGAERIIDALGPSGEGWLAKEACEEFKASTNSAARVARRIGSKGWDCDQKPTGKLDPHLPRLLIADAKRNGLPLGTEIDRVSKWLQAIVDSAGRASV